MSIVIVGLVRAYKMLISPILPFNHCRYYPTCSDYAIEAVQKHGSLKGVWLAVKRIARCHPYSKHEMYDPIP
ncbi:MAG TPA: membrane protein insertion efficiency factor YidD [Bacteroidota bacterium]